jgi:hypothetical protein
MRELTKKELELIGGGYNTGEIVVTGGDDGDWGDYGDWWGDYGDYGDYGDGGDGGGGGDGGDTPPPPPDTDNEIVVTAPKPSETCPVNDWWPNMFEDWGDVQMLMPAIGDWTQFWNDNGTWCFYDENDQLKATFTHDPNGQEELTLSNVNGQPSFNVQGATLGVGVATNDSTSVSITLKGTWSF